MAYNITNDVAAESGVYTVTTDADSGVGSLRYALTESLTGEIIKFASALDGQTITLQSSLTIANGVTIDGLGDDITISGADKYADFIISNAGNGHPGDYGGIDDRRRQCRGFDRRRRNDNCRRRQRRRRGRRSHGFERRGQSRR